MNLAKWRIRKERGPLGKYWLVLAPGNRWTTEAHCDSFADALQFLAVRQRWAERGFR